MMWVGPRGFLGSWHGRFQKVLVFMTLALALAVFVADDQALICPTAKAGPAFQVPSAPRIRKGRKGGSLGWVQGCPLVHTWL